MMSFSYSGNPASNRIDECRFLLGDMDESNPIMQDEEIAYIIAQSNDSVNVLRYMLFNHAATIFARDIKRSLGPQSEDPTERLNFFKQQAKEYKDKIAARGITLPKYAYPKIFKKGMQSNPPWRRGY